MRRFNGVSSRWKATVRSVGSRTSKSGKRESIPHRSGRAEETTPTAEIVAHDSFSDGKELDPGAVDAVLDAAVLEFERESARFRQTEQKTFAVLAFGGAALSIGAVTAPAAIRIGAPYGWAVWAILAVWAIGVSCVVVGSRCLLRSLLSLPFRALELDDCVNMNEMAKPGIEVKSRLAATYEKSLLVNAKSGNEKLRLFDSGTKWVRTGFGTLLICLLGVSILTAHREFTTRLGNPVPREVRMLSDRVSPAQPSKPAGTTTPDTPTEGSSTGGPPQQSVDSQSASTTGQGGETIAISGIGGKTKLERRAVQVGPPTTVR